MVHTDDPLYNFHIWFCEHKISQSIDWDIVLDRFKKEIWSYYHTHKRPFEWRNNIDPYAVVVSEIMLQQTQTQRVAHKFPEFIQAFPTFSALAQADIHDLLRMWVGLGYNRRALALQGIAQKVMHDYGGVLSDDPTILQTFKGLGPATSASIVVFAYNKPVMFIETNIRAVFLHTFFNDQEQVSDKALEPLVSATVDQHNAREWYYALMDYGVCIKKLYPNPSRKSKHHTTQSAFEGSDRQVRGAIVRMLTHEKQITSAQVCALFPREQAHIESIFDALCCENMIEKKGSAYVLKASRRVE